MQRLVSFRNVMVAAALVAGTAACNKGEPREEADQAAERVEARSEELREAQRDLADEVNVRREDGSAATRDRAERLQRDDGVMGLPDRVGARLDERAANDGVEDVTEEAQDVTEEATDLAKAASDFEQRRQLRVQELRAVHAVIASQPQLINLLAGPTPLTDRARADVSEKMQVLQMRLDEAGNAIQALQGVTAEEFEDRNDETAKAIERLQDAREDAWNALRDGDRIDAAAS